MRNEKMKRNRKTLGKATACLCALTMLAGSMTACGSSSSGKKDDTVTISFTTWIGYAPLFIAKEKGIFEKNGVNVDLRVIESAGDIKSAIASGAIQGYAQTIDTVIMGIGAGLDSTQVLALDTSDGGDGIVCKNEYNSIEDLRGKKVALDTSGGASLFYFNYVIGQYDMSMDDFDIQNMSAGDAGSAFVAAWMPLLPGSRG